MNSMRAYSDAAKIVTGDDFCIYTTILHFWDEYDITKFKGIR